VTARNLTLRARSARPIRLNGGLSLGSLPSGLLATFFNSLLVDSTALRGVRNPVAVRGAFFFSSNSHLYEE
jgi:hypothetical protein